MESKFKNVFRKPGWRNHRQLLWKQPTDKTKADLQEIINRQQRAKQPTDKTKADVQEVINRHQQAALLEANDTIRALEEQREEHRILLREQQELIHKLQQQQESQNETGGTSNGTSSEIEELKRQLHERDALIAMLQRQHQLHDGTSTVDSSSKNQIETGCFSHKEEKDVKEISAPSTEEELKAEITRLKANVQSLTDQTKEQQEEIGRLHKILNEIETFYEASRGEDEEEKERGDAESAINTIHEPRNSSIDTIAEEDSESSPEEEDDDTTACSNGTSTSKSNELSLPQKQQRSPQMTLQGNQLVLLISSMPANRTVAANQSRLETILQGLEISPDEIQVLDGCDQDPATVNIRNDLFRISGLRAKYPQLFLVNFADNNLTFVGDYETVIEMHDTQTLENTLGLVPI